MMPTVTEREKNLEIREHMAWGRRAFFLLLGLFPLIAPYELLLQPDWTSFANFFFLISLAISLGAIFLSGFLFFIAFAGLSTLLSFDATARTFTYIHYAPIVPIRRELIAFDTIKNVKVEKHDWTDGAPTYSLRVHLDDERTYKSASFSTQNEARSTLEKIEDLLG
jgi:hypothetical protein